MVSRDPRNASSSCQPDYLDQNPNATSAVLVYRTAVTSTPLRQVGAFFENRLTDTDEPTSHNINHQTIWYEKNFEATFHYWTSPPNPHATARRALKIFTELEYIHAGLLYQRGEENLSFYLKISAASSPCTIFFTPRAGPYPTCAHTAFSDHLDIYKEK